MESVIGVASILTATGAGSAPPDQRAGTVGTVVGFAERRPRLIDLDSSSPMGDRAMSAPEADSAPAPGHLVRDLLVTAQLMREELEGRLLAANGNLHSWSILSALEANDGVSQKFLSDACRIDAPTITRVLDRLEAQGFVKRRRDVDDRRVVRVNLTGKGRLQHLHLARAAQALEDELGSALPPCTGEGLRVALAQLAAARRAHPSARSRG